jgi:hypothetical protein
MVTEQEKVDVLQKILRKIETERAQYWVQSGDQVSIQTDGKYVVSKVLMRGAIEAALNDKKIWGLFCLVSLTSGGIYAEPVPVMSEGTVDLRRLVAPHVMVTYKKTVGKNRVYDAVMVRDGYRFTIKVNGFCR